MTARSTDRTAEVSRTATQMLTHVPTRDDKCQYARDGQLTTTMDTPNGGYNQGERDRAEEGINQSEFHSGGAALFLKTPSLRLDAGVVPNHQ
jgi:hypothetical protein